ncbi:MULTISPECIES: hypothetical protein [unclassified Kitasatospora]|uniref:hypothetical protein n=1 Tax=unclassified Kitasatospora TaxID=2633591 RepID=UPI0037F99D4D
MRSLIRRAWFLPLTGALAALLALVLSTVAALSQWRTASRIDAAPLRVDATITAAVAMKGGTRYTLTYRVADRDYSTDSLTPHGVRSPGIGATVLLEVAADDPEASRVTGSHYPDDALQPTMILVATAAVAGLAISLRFLHTATRRNRPSP